MLFWSLVFCLAGETLGSAANAKACCAAAGVSRYCGENFCNAEQVPSFNTAARVSCECVLNLGETAKCLADGRNHLPCCQSQTTAYQSCLHLCNGTAPSVDTSTWIDQRRYHNDSSFDDYANCLSLNLVQILACVRDGYATGPFPPKSVNARHITPTTALIIWLPPENLRDRVKEYVVSYRNAAGFTQENATNETSLTLHDLSPDTEYEVNVVAKAKTGLTDSLPSKVVFVTERVAQLSHPLEDEVRAGQHATITLACKHVVLKNTSNVTMDWLKLSGSEYHPVDVTRKLEDNRTKFANKSYVEKRHKHGGTTFVHTLTVADIESSDFGSYKCASKNPFGEASGVTLVKQATGVVPNAPRNSTACCLSETQRTGCGNASCNLTDRRDVRLPPEQWQQQECAVIETLAKLWCPIYGFDLTACCLREEVPTRCLSYCNGKLQLLEGGTMLTLAEIGCLDHYRSSIAKCHLESRQGIPNPPSSVAAAKSPAPGANAIRVLWVPVRNAQHYLVYHRLAGDDDWMSNVTKSTSITLRNLHRRGRYQIVVLSENSGGFSENSEAAYITLA